MSSDPSITTLVLASHLAARDARPLTPREYWALVDSIEDPALLTEAAESKDPERIAGLLAAAQEVRETVAQLAEGRITTLTAFDEHYPPILKERLGSAAPPVLFTAGPLSHLARPGLGVVGSRSPSPDAVRVARRAGELAASNALPVVSGGAKGIDQQAMYAAIQAGGNTVAVLADSLERQLRDRDVQEAIEEEALLLITTQNPSVGFSVGTAMGRNKIIYALSFVTLVVTTDLERGGTWSGATEALRRAYGGVAVWEGAGAGAGNRRLATIGATPVSDLDQLLHLQERPQEPPEQEEQLTMEM